MSVGICVGFKNRRFILLTLCRRPFVWGGRGGGHNFLPTGCTELKQIFFRFFAHAHKPKYGIYFDLFSSSLFFPLPVSLKIY